MNKPTERRSLGIASLVGHLVTAAAVLAVPVICIAPAHRSACFWYKIAWTEFLALLLWAYLGGAFWFLLPGTTRRKGLAGVLPVTGLLVFGYAITSVILVLLCDWASRGHWVAQVVLLLGFALLLVLFEFARIGAVAGTEPIPLAIRTPQDLAAMLRLHEERLWTPASEAATRRLSDAIKALREKLQHSLPEAGRIGQAQEYQDFARQTEAFCTDLQNLPTDSAEQANVARLQDVATQLAARSEYIASALKTRPS